jgi:tRNA(fMet)-specific endonuclease VapC
MIIDLLRSPQVNRAVNRLAAVGDATVMTSVIVAGALRYGCLEKGSARLTERVEAVLREIEVIARHH